MFSLDEGQLKKIKEWTDSHAFHDVGAIGGRYTYSFTPTSIGIVEKVTDCITQEVLDVTDYKSW